MTDLTDRQVFILKAIVEEYTSTAEPVGSETLDKKFNLGVSPATIRNEMSYLTKQGYLAQPHTSAGRVPTPKAIRLYVNEIMREQDLSVAEEVAVKESVWDKRHQLEPLLREAIQELAERTDSIGVAIIDDGRIFTTGYAHVLDMPEFFDIDVTRSLFGMLDETNRLLKYFQETEGEGTRVIMGSEFGIRHMEPVSCVYTRFNAGDQMGTIGVMGSLRFNYPKVIPLVRHIGMLVDDINR
jgi:heat-inducible transcriptional repressor